NRVEIARYLHTRREGQFSRTTCTETQSTNQRQVGGEPGSCCTACRQEGRDAGGCSHEHGRGRRQSAARRAVPGMVAVCRYVTRRGVPAFPRHTAPARTHGSAHTISL